MWWGYNKNDCHKFQNSSLYIHIQTFSESTSCFFTILTLKVSLQLLTKSEHYISNQSNHIPHKLTQMYMYIAIWRITIKTLSDSDNESATLLWLRRCYGFYAYLMYLVFQFLTTSFQNTNWWVRWIQLLISSKIFNLIHNWNLLKTLVHQFNIHSQLMWEIFSLNEARSEIQVHLLWKTYTPKLEKKTSTKWYQNENYKINCLFLKSKN